MIFGLTLLSVFVIITTIITASGKPKVSMIVALIVVPIDIALNLTLIPFYELKGETYITTNSIFGGENKYAYAIIVCKIKLSP